MPAKRYASSGGPSEGIATFCRSSIFEPGDFLLAIHVEKYVIVNDYLLTYYRNDLSEFLFTFACEKLSSCLSKICQLDKCCIIIEDFNCNLTDGLLLCTSILSGIFKNWLRILPKDLDYTCSHNLSHVSKLDHAVSCHLFTSLLTSSYQTTFQYLHLIVDADRSCDLIDPHENKRNIRKIKKKIKYALEGFELDDMDKITRIWKMQLDGIIAKYCAGMLKN